MKRLSKAQREEKARLVRVLNLLSEDVSVTINRANEAIREAGEDVQQALEKYNAALEEARGFRDEVVSDIETTWDEKSDRWKESDAGGHYADWLDSWRNLDLDDLSWEEVPEIDEPGNVEHGTELEELPDEVER